MVESKNENSEKWSSGKIRLSKNENAEKSLRGKTIRAIPSGSNQAKAP